MNWLFIHSIIAPLVVGSPLLVVLVVWLIVQRDSAEAGRSLAFSWRELTHLSLVTAMAWAAFGVWFLLDGRSISAGLRGPFLGVAEIGSSLTIFWLFAVPVLSKIERVALWSVQGQVAAEELRYRAASLRARRISNYLPMPVHVFAVLICVIALVYLAIQISVAGPDARLTMPIGYGAIGAIFLLLYEVWIWSEALDRQVLGLGHTSGPTPEEAEWIRRRRVREIFILQNTLTLLFSLMALIAIGIRWESPSGWRVGVALGVVGGIVGGVGCAFALSSEMRDRSLRLAIHKPL